MPARLSEVKGPVAIKNVAAFMAMTQRLIDRDPHLPGIGVCHSPSGYGKTYASIFAQNKTNAVRVEVGDSWTRRTLLQAILTELGEKEQLRKRMAIADLAGMALAALGDEPSRPLIVDEADKLVDRGMIEIVRELHEHSGIPVILIGEEKLPNKLLAFERVHNRVLDWFPAQPCDLDDTRELAHAFAPDVAIDDALLELIRTQSGGRARRIVVNLSHAREFAKHTKRVKQLTLDLWGSKPFYTGEPPHVRHVEPYKRTTKAAA
jgi:DNA transposition AAA+ family ATPase